MKFLKGKSLLLQFILLLIWLCIAPSTTNAADTGETAPSSEASGDPEAPPPPKSKSFFLFGGFFHKIRQRWSGQQQSSGPIYAGVDFPLLGYQNCPIYDGCNQQWAYRPIPYSVPAIYMPNSPYGPSSPQQQQQQQQQQENKVIILHTGHSGQLSSYPHSLPYPLYPPPITAAQSHVPTTLTNIGQQYPPYTFNDYGPVVYSPNYVPVPAHNRPGTAVAVATSDGSGGCSTPLYACNFG